MTSANLQTAKGLEKDIANITTVQDLLTSLTGEKVLMVITDSTGAQVISNTDLVNAIGQSGYDTIAATALASINSTLTSTKTAKQTSLDAL